MSYIFGVQSDIGTTKEVNQDAVAIKVVDTDFGDVLFAIVCDGMGGFEKGEVASASMLSAMLNWFENDFPSLGNDFLFDDIKNQWNIIIQSMNEKIMNYGKLDRIKLGTTLSMILMFNNEYYIGHVGDSRIYKIADGIEILTEDHTLVNQKYKEGKITEDEIETDEERNVLLQCIGASRKVEPQFINGTFKKDDVFMLCSDGFRHEISQNEMLESLSFDNLKDKNSINIEIAKLIDRAEQRKEEDNITAAVIKVI